MGVINNKLTLLALLFLIDAFACVSAGANALIVKSPISDLNDRYQSKIEDLYSAIGLNVIWVDMPIVRAVAELENGNVDAMLLNPCSSSVKEFTLLCVDDFLIETTVFLVCRSGVTCNRSVLSKATTNILGPSAAGLFLQANGYKARLRQIESIDDYGKLLVEKRFDYAFLLGQDRPFTEYHASLEFFALYNINQHHVISTHRKEWHEKIVKQLSHRKTLPPKDLSSNLMH